MSEESIYIEEEFEASENGQGYKTWEEEIKVTGDELVGKVQELIKEATARKITVKDEHGKTLISIPLWSGVFGVLVFGPWSALALIAAWAANLSIIIEYVDLDDIAEDVAETAAELGDDLTAIKGIGPKKAEQLAEAGIRTFAKLAKTSPEALAEIASVSEETAAAVDCRGQRIALSSTSTAEKAPYSASGLTWVRRGPLRRLYLVSSRKCQPGLTLLPTFMESSIAEFAADEPAFGGGIMPGGGAIEVDFVDAAAANAHAKIETADAARTAQAGARAFGWAHVAGLAPAPPVIAPFAQQVDDFELAAPAR